MVNLTIDGQPHTRWKSPKPLLPVNLNRMSAVIRMPRKTRGAVSRTSFHDSQDRKRMRPRVFPLLAPLAKPRLNEDGQYETKARGLAILNSPQLNKGTAFTALERKTLGLTGLLPPEISTLA